MPRAPHPRRTLAALALGGLIAAGGAAGPAGAAGRSAPCPTAGTTLASGVSPATRVWRDGQRVRACVRTASGRRTVRTLGTWTTGTKVAVGGGSVAWTTTVRSEALGLADRIATTDVRSGRRWFSTARAALAPDTATPASEDRVLRLLTTDRATAWVTSRGVVGAALRRVDREALEEWGAGEVPYHVGRRFFLGDAGTPAAASVARGLSFAVGGESDECGGTDLHELRVPPYGTVAARSFVFASSPVRAAPWC